MFRGRFYHTIDPKGRLSIPSRFRDALEERGERRLVLVPNEHGLEALTMEEWGEIEEKVKALPRMNPDVERFKRLYMSRAMDVALDGQGRIQIPPDYRKQAGLDKNVVLVGSLGKFEIWDRQQWEEYERLNQTDLPSLRQRMSELGV